MISRLSRSESLALSNFKQHLSLQDEIAHMARNDFFESKAPSDDVKRSIQQDLDKKGSLFELTRVQLLWSMIENRVSVDAVDQLPPPLVDQLVDYLKNKTKACLVKYKILRNFRGYGDGLINSSLFSSRTSALGHLLGVNQLNANTPR